MSEADREREQVLAQVRQKIALGLEQLDRGEGLDGEETFAELLLELDSQGNG
jgi:antitoxin ParD1/3/4